MYKWIWEVLQKRPTFGYFFPVAFLDAEHHFQFPTVTLIRFLHLHLIQQFQWPGHRGPGKPAEERASSAELEAIRGFVSPNAADLTPWLALQINFLCWMDFLAEQAWFSFGCFYSPIAKLMRWLLWENYSSSSIFMNQSSQQQLHKALKHNWKAASWHLPFGFLQRLPFSPPSPH